MRKQRQTHGEEVANVLTHGAGMLFGLTAIVVLMIAGIRTGDPWVIGSFAVYALCMTSSYVTSTFYHAASDPKRKCQLRRWDHSAIYLHIAAYQTAITKKRKEKRRNGKKKKGNVAKVIGQLTT